MDGMKRSTLLVAIGALGTAAILIAVSVGLRSLDRRPAPRGAGAPAKAVAARSTEPAQATPQAALENEASRSPSPAPESCQGFLYGRIHTVDGTVYEGRLRWGGGEEAFWDDYFNGVKTENPWLAYVAPERLPKERRPIEIFGFRIAEREGPGDFGRPFMARFGELARIEAHGRQVRVMLKNGDIIDLDRFEASDFDDGVRVWDGRRGVVDLDSLVVRSVEFLPTPALAEVPGRLRGTVRTRLGEFSGFVAWNRAESMGSDELDGRSPEGALRLRFDTIRSMARRANDSSLVVLREGREIVLSGHADVGSGNRGLYVADPRFGRVLISWEAFEGIDFGEPREGGSGPAYGDVTPGSPLRGSVATRDGRRVAGRLVFDLDESSTTDTLDASSQGVDFSLPFGLIASIGPPSPSASAPGEGAGAGRLRVTLHSGEELQLERGGDLGENNGGLLIFANGAAPPEYVPWREVEEIDLDRPPAIEPPLGGL
jgi:hypothetical protein